MTVTSLLVTPNDGQDGRGNAGIGHMHACKVYRFTLFPSFCLSRSTCTGPAAPGRWPWLFGA